MKQVTLTAPKTFEIQEVEIPKVQPHEALLKVKAVGICGSDIHAYYGKHPFMSFPITLGHETAGEVVQLGEKVQNVKIGDRVVMRPQKVCGTCSMCRGGRYNICKHLEVLGCQCAGGSSDYYAVDAGLLYRLPDDTAYDVGTMIEPLAVGVHAVRRAGDVQGLRVLVIGAGTIGNVVAQSAKALGAESVMITDVSDYKLKMALSCGVDYAVNVGREDLAQTIQEKYGEDGVDLVFECSANAGALNQLLDSGRKGITMVIVGVYGGLAQVNMANVQDREYNLIGTLMYLHEDYEIAIDLLKNNRVHLKELITKEFPLLETEKAYRFIEENRDQTQKVILTVSE